MGDLHREEVSKICLITWIRGNGKIIYLCESVPRLDWGGGKQGGIGFLGVVYLEKPGEKHHVESVRQLFNNCEENGTLQVVLVDPFPHDQLKILSHTPARPVAKEMRLIGEDVVGDAVYDGSCSSVHPVRRSNWKMRREQGAGGSYRNQILSSHGAQLSRGFSGIHDGLSSHKTPGELRLGVGNGPESENVCESDAGE